MNFQAESSSFCDLECRECPNVTMKRERKMLSLEIWSKILNSYVVPYKNYNTHNDCPPTVIMHKDGEPLLNKNLPAMLQMVADVDQSLKIDIYSHGLLLPKKPDFVPFLGRLPNQSRLMVSFHWHNHDGSKNDYTATTAYLRNLVLSGELPRNVELIIVSHLIAPSTQEILDAWKATWSDCISTGRLTVHTNASINPWTGRMEDVATCHYNGCPYGDFGHMFFGATGNVVACCMDLEEEIIFGNVMTDDPAEMVAKVEAFYTEQTRRQKASEKPEYQVCYDCFGHKRTDLVQVGGLVV